MHISCVLLSSYILKKNKNKTKPKNSKKWPASVNFVPELSLILRCCTTALHYSIAQGLIRCFSGTLLGLHCYLFIHHLLMIYQIYNAKCIIYPYISSISSSSSFVQSNPPKIEKDPNNINIKLEVIDIRFKRV